MNSRITRQIIYGQVGLTVAVIVCAILIPKGLATNDGFSYYGSHMKTVIPFALGLIALGWSFFMSARALASFPDTRPVVNLLYTIFPLFAIAIATPYAKNPTLHWIHVATTIAIFSVQLLIAAWLLIIARWDEVNILLTCILALEGLAGLIFVNPDIGFLIHIEYTFQVTFALIMIRSLRTLRVPIPGT